MTRVKKLSERDSWIVGRVVLPVEALEVRRRTQEGEHVKGSPDELRKGL